MEIRNHRDAIKFGCEYHLTAMRLSCTKSLGLFNISYGNNLLKGGLWRAGKYLCGRCYQNTVGCCVRRTTFRLNTKIADAGFRSFRSVPVTSPLSSHAGILFHPGLSNVGASFTGMIVVPDRPCVNVNELWLGCCATRTLRGCNSGIVVHVSGCQDDPVFIFEDLERPFLNIQVIKLVRSETGIKSDACDGTAFFCTKNKRASRQCRCCCTSSAFAVCSRCIYVDV